MFITVRIILLSNQNTILMAYPGSPMMIMAVTKLSNRWWCWLSVLFIFLEMIYKPEWGPPLYYMPRKLNESMIWMTNFILWGTLFYFRLDIIEQLCHPQSRIISKLAFDRDKPWIYIKLRIVLGRKLLVLIYNY